MAFLDEAGLRTLWGRTTSKIATIRSEVVSYTGTGSAGVANPTSVTFSKAPGAIIMLGYTSGAGGWWYQIFEPDGDFRYMLPTSVFPTEYTRGFGFGTENLGNLYGKKSADGKTFSWYSYDNASGDGKASDQCNYSGYEYYVLGLFTETFALGNNAGSGGNTGGGTTGGGGTTTQTVTCTIDDYGNITVAAGTTWIEYIASGADGAITIDNDNNVRVNDDCYLNDPEGNPVLGSDVIVDGIYTYGY